MCKGEIIIYRETDHADFQIDVRVQDETVWLNRIQMTQLFGRDVKTIGKHINNALNEELQGLSVVAKFATTASDGKIYSVEYYNLDVIISVGYRVKSKRGVQFRRWANKILKEYLLKEQISQHCFEKVENEVQKFNEQFPPAEIKEFFGENSKHKYIPFVSFIYD
jgi:hypothetical protein